MTHIACGLVLSVEVFPTISLLAIVPAARMKFIVPQYLLYSSVASTTFEGLGRFDNPVILSAISLLYFICYLLTL